MSTTKNKKQSSKKITDYLVPGLLILIIIGSGVKFLTSFFSYKAAKDEYDRMNEYVTVKEDIPVVPTLLDSSDSDKVSDLANAEKLLREEEPISFTILDVNSKELEQINEDYCGWLYVPSLSISYPVVQGDDNESYLHKTFEGERNSSGCVFMDCVNYDNFRDPCTYLYAHNMKNGSMFGSLKQFRDDQSLCSNDPFVYVYTEKNAYQYEIFAFYLTQKGSKSYDLNWKKDDYDSFIDSAFEFSEYQSIDTFDFEDKPRILTLSTCNGSTGTSTRMVVHAVLINEIELDNN